MTKTIRIKNNLKGQRLNELIKKRFKTRSEFVKKLELEGSNVGKAMLSMYINGTKNISDSNIELFAYLLDVDMDYLYGDYPMCKSYEEYESFVKQIGLLTDIPIVRYESFFTHCGLHVSGHTDTLDEHTVIGLYRTTDRTMKHFTENDMDTFLNDIVEYVNRKFDAYTSIYDEDDYEPQKNDIEKIKQYRKEATKRTASNKVKKGVKKRT